MLRSSRLLVVVAVVVLCLAPVAAAATDPVHWGYDGETGPEHWGSLSPEYAACSEGKEQSPVDIPATAPVNPPGLQLAYRPSALTIANNGHSIQVSYDAGSTLEIGGASYPLLQFHLHSLSEHTLKGANTAMELHLVHKDAAGRTAVAGVLIVEGAHNAAYEPILAHMPAEEGEPETIAGATVDAAALLPADQSYYRYNGSLTTPPCTEGVSWFVMATPVELSAEQIAAFRALYDHNYRPVQPLNGRAFLLTSALPASVLDATGGTGAAGPLLVAAIGAGLLLAGLALALHTRRGRAG
jgi:carbonic anhydrase